MRWERKGFGKYSYCGAGSWQGRFSFGSGGVEATGAGLEGWGPEAQTPAPSRASALLQAPLSKLFKSKLDVVKLNGGALLDPSLGFGDEVGIVGGDEGQGLKGLWLYQEVAKASLNAVPSGGRIVHVLYTRWKSAILEKENVGRSR
ncbi:hypothetical protein BHE74_00059473 [Ensete ventricosum]|nr:hypothetical protein BHE74_00059473 [Ensete ventricosum]